MNVFIALKGSHFMIFICMSSLLTSEQKTENNDQSVLELEGAVMRQKFPVLDSQVPFSAIQKEKANVV